MSTYQDVKNEVALRAIDACGDKGILKSVNNDELTGDVKIKHFQVKTKC